MNRKAKSRRRPAKGKRPYHHGDLRNALIRAALELIEETGKDGLSLRAAAARAGVSPGAPYRHFESKEALLAAVAAEGFLRLESDVASAGARHPGDASAQLLAVAGAYLGLAEASPGFFRIMFGPYSGWEAESAAVNPLCERVFAALTGMIRDGLARGNARARDPEALALAFWSVLHGLATLSIDKKLEGFREAGRPLKGYLLGIVESQIPRWADP